MSPTNPFPDEAVLLAPKAGRGGPSVVGVGGVLTPAQVRMEDSLGFLGATGTVAPFVLALRMAGVRPAWAWSGADSRSG